MIDLQNVSHSFELHGKLKRVLSNVSLRVEPGQSLGILGGAACGKTTLLRILSKTIPPERGRVEHAGRVSWPVGYQQAFDKKLSPEDNCRFLARLYGAHEDEVVDATRAYADIARRFFLPMKHCSKEQQNKIAFALCMTIKFDVYLIDGDPAVGDKAFQEKCYEVLDARREAGSSLVITARKPKPLRRLAHDYAIMKKGKIRRFQSLDAAVAKVEAA